MLAQTKTNASVRKYDINLWPEIPGNPLTKSGVFQYAGRQIHASLDPNKLYNVLRPPQELQDQECIDSFKLIPFIDGHAMLGHKRGNLPAEEKGVSGVVGENVYYEHPYLKGNLVVYSKRTEDKIDNGKKDLSAGYHCLFKLEKGVYNGVAYDAIQYQIRGNHVALVNEGRSGPDVAVLDEYQFIYDSVEITSMKDNEEKKETKDAEEPSLKSLDAAIKAMDAKYSKGMDAIASSVAKLAKDEEEKKKETEDEEETEEEKKKREEREKAEKEKKETTDEEEKEKKEAKDAEVCANKGMDSAVRKHLPTLRTQIMDSIRTEFAQKDELVRKLIPHVGVFDHAVMSVDDVAVYALDKLKLSAKKGHEVSVLDGYLLGKKVSSPVNNSVMDSKPKTGQVSAYINGGTQ